MAYTLQQLSDIEDIRTVKHRYFRGIDTADSALLSGLFTDDIDVEYRGGGYLVKLSGRENMLDFLANSFHSRCVAMHHGHMPEITLTGDDTAEGIWYLEDIFIDLEKDEHTIGSAIYHDWYRREDGQWKMSRAEYDRVMELVMPVSRDMKITTNYLGKVGRKPEDRTDTTHLITWFDEAA